MSNENTPQTHNQLIDPLRVTEIPMKAWGASDGTHTVLFTHGLGPCIGLTVYDPVTKKGFMGHIANPALEQGTLDEMFAAIRSTTEDTARLQIWVRGGQSDLNMTENAAKGKGLDFPQMGKDTINEYLENLVGQDKTGVDIQYDTEPMLGDTATMQRLDTESGEFVSKAYGYGEYRTALGLLSLQGISREHDKP